MQKISLQLSHSEQCQKRVLVSSCCVQYGLFLLLCVFIVHSFCKMTVLMTDVEVDRLFKTFLDMRSVCEITLSLLPTDNFISLVFHTLSGCELLKIWPLVLHGTRFCCMTQGISFSTICHYQTFCKLQLWLPFLLCHNFSYIFLLSVFAL